MKVLFEYPYIIITIFVFCFIVLGLIGAYFALQGVKTARGTQEFEFSTVNRVKQVFLTLGKLYRERSLVYIDVSLDNVRSLYSEGDAVNLFEEIKPVLLKVFSDGDDNVIAFYDNKNFVAVNSCDAQKIKSKAVKCVEEINHSLLKYKAITAAQIRFGVYSVFGSDVLFDECVSRAKKACTIAENENELIAEWSSHQGKALEDKIKIENNIESEIDNNRFFLEYQPVVDANSKKIVGAEVLARLNSQNDGILKPGSFLSAVDSVGLNNKFDYYIFEKNCKWISNNKEQRAKYVYTINFSRTTLCDENFARDIIGIVEKYQIPYSSVAIEVLEDKILDNGDTNVMVNNLVKLKEKGVLILLDDFGTGYTSFGDLQNITIDTVKIDKSITHNANTEKGFLILKNIVRTAKDLGCKTVCEGIENKEQEEIVIKAGCDMLQGYYYYRPMPVTRLEKYFEEQ